MLSRLATVGRRMLARIRHHAMPLALLLFGAAVVVLRDASFFYAPRVWAEEAMYLVFAREHNWLAALLQRHSGYLALWTNAVALIATRCCPIEDWARLTTLGAASVQLVAIAMLAWNRHSMFQPLWRRVVAVLVLLLAPISGEVWLNTINSQFYFSLTTMLILLDGQDGVNTPRRFRNVLMIILAGLTSVVPVFLLPLFIHSALARKDRLRFAEAAALAACGLVQAVVFLLSLSDVRASRVVGEAVLLMPMVLATKSIVLPLGGLGVADRLGQTLARLWSTSPLTFVACAAVVGMAGLCAMGFLARRMPGRAGWYLAGAYLLLTVPSVLLALGPKTGLLSGYGSQRYFYVPNVLVMLLLLGNLPVTWRTPDLKAPHVVCALLLVTALVVAAREYRGTLIVDPSWPRWRDEVEVWRDDPTHRIAIWPAGWDFQLDP